MGPSGSLQCLCSPLLSQAAVQILLERYKCAYLNLKNYYSERHLYPIILAPFGSVLSCVAVAALMFYLDVKVFTWNGHFGSGKSQKLHSTASRG